jgi:hypothetical protein
VWNLAQFTHSTRTTPTPYRSRGGAFDLRVFQESTTVSSNIIKYGDVVQFDVNVATANHRLRKSTQTTAPNVLSTAFLGLAMENSADIGSSVSATSPGSNLLVCIANKDTEFKWPTKLTGATHTSSIVGKGAAIGYDSTLNFYYCDVAGASTAGDISLIVTEVIDAGTTNGFVAAKFISTSVARLVSAAY